MPRYTPIDLDAVSMRLRRLRGRLGLYQGEIAMQTGFPLRTIQSWEAKKNPVQTSRANYERMAAFYSEKLGEEITVDFLLAQEDGAADPEAFEAAVMEIVDRRLSELGLANINRAV